MDWLILIRFLGQDGADEKHSDNKDSESWSHECIRKESAGDKTNAAFYEELLPATITV
jgi:hypothetical protein